MPNDSSDSQTTTQRTEPWEAQIPYLKEAFGEAQGLYQSGGPSYYEGSTVADMSDPSRAAISGMTERGLGGSPLTGAAQGLAQNTLQGDYLSQQNPAFQGMLNSSLDSARTAYEDTVMPGIASQFSAGGRYGSPAHQNVVGQANEDFAKQATNMAGQLGYQNYGNERNIMNQTMGQANSLANQDYRDLEQLAGAGSVLDQYNQTQTNADIDRWNFSQQQPYNDLANYLGMISGGYGSSSTQTQPVNSNPWGQVIGGGLSLASLL